MCVCVWHLTVLCRDVDVEVETVLALILQVCSSSIQVLREPHGHHDFGQCSVDVLWACWRKPCGIPDVMPSSGCFGGLEAAVSYGRRGIRDAKELFHWAKDLVVQLLPDAADLTVTGGNDGVFGGTVIRALARR